MKTITEREWNKALREHLEKYYKKKKVVEIEKGALGRKQIKVVYFEDGTFAAFKRAYKNSKLSWCKYYGGWYGGPKRKM